MTWLAGGGLVAGTALAVWGMPPLPLHMPTHYLGIMGPLCGMTRATAAALRGDLAGAWSYNPASLPLVAGAVAVLLRSVLGRVRGRWVSGYLRVNRGGWWLIAGVLAALTVNQQSHAELLLGG